MNMIFGRRHVHRRPGPLFPRPLGTLEIARAHSFLRRTQKEVIKHLPRIEQIGEWQVVGQQLRRVRPEVAQRMAADVDTFSALGPRLDPVIGFGRVAFA
jgi:hypothetical protein